MPLFKKKEVSKSSDSLDLPPLPELPELPKLSNFPNQDEREFSRPRLTKPIESPETRSLPSFPYNNRMGSDLSQEAIKSAVVPPSIKPPAYKDKMPDFSKSDFSKSEFSKIEPKPFESLSSIKPQTQKPAIKTYTPTPMAKMPAIKPSGKIEPVYVRLDKYKSAVTNFQEIQHKVLEIDSLLKQIREEKRKEEEELTSWEEKIAMLKERIDAIDQNIFSKLD